jgi:hypothetical protein
VAGIGGIRYRNCGIRRRLERHYRGCAGDIRQEPLRSRRSIASRRWCGVSLDGGSLQSETRANLLNIGPGVGTLLTVEGEVDDAEVNAQASSMPIFSGSGMSQTTAKNHLFLTSIRST